MQREQPQWHLSARLLENLVLAVLLAFFIVFLVGNYAGLASLWVLVRDAVISAPGFVVDIFDYYVSVPARQLVYSALVGAVFGVVSTVWVALSTGNENNGSRPRRTGRIALRAGVVGILAGGVGAQILMLPTHHCTYEPGIDGAQFRLGLVVTVLSALILLVPAWTVLRRNAQPMPDRPAGYFRSLSLPYLLVLPTLAFLALFLYYPAIEMMLGSLHRKIFPLPQEQPACLQNYVTLAEDTIYRNSFQTTLLITVVITLASLGTALAIAMLASQKVKGAHIYRTLLVWPYAISPVVTGVIFLSMFREGGVGVLNWALENTVGLSPHWLTDRTLAPLVVGAAAVWNILGFNVLFYIAGLQNIPQDLLEAAALDGADRVTRFWRITFPLLSPFTFFLLVTNVTYSFYGIYGTVETLTPTGGPPLGPGGTEGSATNVLIFKLYKDAFQAGAPAGLGAAQAVILFLMVAGLIVIQFRYIERRVTYEG